MKLQNMFKKTNRRNRSVPEEARPEVPEGLLRKCNMCGAAIIAEDVREGNYICPKCHGYFRVHARRRIEMIADADTFEEWDEELVTRNPLHFKGYEEKVQSLQEKTGLKEAIVTGKAKIDGHPAVIGVCDGGTTSGDLVCLFRRRQDAGGDCVSDADGKDFCGVETAQ